MADGAEEGARQVYDLPRRRRRAATWDWIRARESWVTWATRSLRRRCS
jgi:hypothetical protein